MVEASVAKDKNICQACLVDMTYGVPVGVRDALLAGLCFFSLVRGSKGLE
jgi:hypothetical protein